MKLIERLRKSTGMAHNIPHLDNAPFLKVSELNVRYDGRPALYDINFEVEAGQRVAVVGPNGAGKSTLFQVIAGVLPASSGSVAISGHQPSGHICIAYVPQRNDVDWDFPVTIADVVMMGRIGKLGLLRGPKEADWKLVHECIDMVGLTALAGRQINALSGGQQQRMFIAQAVAQEAELLMMDEPLSGLDAPSQEEVFDILTQLSKRGVTVMIATHDLGLAAARFDQAMLLNQRLLGFGAPDEIFTEERLRAAYGGHLQLIPTDEGVLVIGDNCCDD
ncbi:MAG: metal ABC transporter ATP-binding protein [Anaerolineae bacterium]|nr:metal ABC transporter ATP-binding protein [Anaerolineae bacterium]